MACSCVCLWGLSSCIPESLVPLLVDLRIEVAMEKLISSDNGSDMLALQAFIQSHYIHPKTSLSCIRSTGQSTLSQRLHVQHFRYSASVVKIFHFTQNSQRISIDSSRSSPKYLRFGNIQTSVLVRFLFPSINQVITIYSITHPLHSDYAQVYAALSELISSISFK